MSHEPVDEPVPRAAQGGFVRCRLTVDYDGTHFHGWAAQPGQRTVAGEVAGALATVLRLGEPPQLVVAGRTDAGVHAYGQVAHVDLPADALRGRDLRGLARSLSAVAAPDCRIAAVAIAHPDFDARFAALGRRYVYRITDHDAGAAPLRRADTLAVDHPLDVDAMHRAGSSLLGVHDFVGFCRARQGASSIRRVTELTVVRDGELIVVSIAADGFCHQMVRSIVGALIDVGTHRRHADFLDDVLRAESRVSAVRVAPAHGLTFMGVDYPPDDQLAERVAMTRRRRAVLTPERGGAP